METVQLVIANATYAAALRDLLTRSTGARVAVADRPETEFPGVVVLDSLALKCLPRGYPNPERIVLITQNEPQLLARAWEAGIVSVVFENDPLNTAILAIMAARLRLKKAGRQEPAVHGRQ